MTFLAGEEGLDEEGGEEEDGEEDEARRSQRRVIETFFVAIGFFCNL